MLLTIGRCGGAGATNELGELLTRLWQFLSWLLVFRLASLTCLGFLSTYTLLCRGGGGSDRLDIVRLVGKLPRLRNKKEIEGRS